MLDLDQTLLHATVDAQVGEWLRDPEHPLHGRLEEVHPLSLPSTPQLTYYVRLRPGLREFLQEMTTLFELHVYTMGSHEYALAVVGLIDEGGRLFGDRVLSRDHNGLPEDRKALQRLFPCDDRTVLILDDRADVWQYSRNLVWIEPYSFWVVSAEDRRRHSTSSTSNSSSSSSNWGVEEHVSRCQNDQDQGLATAAQLLRDLHARYFAALKTVPNQPPRFSPLNPELPDLKDLLDQKRQGLLQGCVLAFSGLIPKDSGQQHYWWQLAEQHGARVCEDLSDPQLTHLISSRRDTAKVMEAQQRGAIWIVHPDWLIKSIMRWRRQPEEDFSLAPVANLDRQPSGETLIPSLQVVQHDLVEAMQKELEEVSSFEEDDDDDDDDDDEAQDQDQEEEDPDNVSQSNLSAQLGLPSRKRARLSQESDSGGFERLLEEELVSE